MGNLRLKIDWPSLILGRKFTVFVCFTLHLRAVSQFKPPPGGGGGLIFGGAIQRRVFCVTSLRGLYLEGLIHGGAYFRDFTVFLHRICQFQQCFDRIPQYTG